MFCSLNPLAENIHMIAYFMSDIVNVLFMTPCDCLVFNGDSYYHKQVHTDKVLTSVSIRTMLHEMED